MAVSEFVLRRFSCPLLLVGISLLAANGWCGDKESRAKIQSLRKAYMASGSDLAKKKAVVDEALDVNPTVAKGLRGMVRQDFEQALSTYVMEFRKVAVRAKVTSVDEVVQAETPLAAKRQALAELAGLLNRLSASNESDKSNAFAEVAHREAAIINMVESAVLKEAENKARLEAQQKKRSEQGIAYRQYLSDKEADVLKLVNEERRKKGLRPLKHDPRLSAAARDHSKDMTKHDFFSHTSPLSGKEKFSQRAKHFKTTARAENIAWTTRGPEDVLDMWMKSDGHRKNILGKKSSRFGVGNDGKHWTLLFGG